MLKIRNPFYVVKEKKPTVQVLCYHCGAVYRVGFNQLRSPNYCNTCK
jgi:uncharacterized Zn finger protein